MTLPHRYAFGKTVELGHQGLRTADDWDVVRKADPAFGFTQDRETWRLAAESSAELGARADAMSAVLRRWGATRAVSVGVGTGMLEYLLLRRTPDLELRCGDFAEKSLQELRSRFVECPSIERMDLTDPEWCRDAAEVVILNRVDTELSGDEWRSVFAKLHDRGSLRVIWIPAGLLTPAALFREAQTMIVGMLRGMSVSQAGYLRNRAAMIDLFAPRYRIEGAIRAGGKPLWPLVRQA